MKINKRLLSALPVLALTAGCCLTLTGCHGREGLAAFEIPAEFDVSQNYEITFWAKNDTNKTQTDIYEKAIDDFEALYPNITVNLRLIRITAKFTMMSLPILQRIQHQTSALPIPTISLLI